MTQSGASPAEILERVFQCRRTFDLEGFIALFADDGVLEHPSQPPNEPTRRMRGADEIRSKLGPTWSHRRDAGFEDLPGSVIVYESADGDGIVADIERRVRIPSGDVVHLPRVLVMRVRDGKISSLRDFYDFFTQRDLLGLPAPR